MPNLETVAIVLLLALAAIMLAILFARPQHNDDVSDYTPRYAVRSPLTHMPIVLETDDKDEAERARAWYGGTIVDRKA